jgi:predicted secreted Zn-dependent protease
MAAHDEQVEKVARAIYDAEPTIRVQVRVPRTTADFTSSLEIRNVPWSALDECDPHEKSAMVTSRNLARAAIAAMEPALAALVAERDAQAAEVAKLREALKAAEKLYGETLGVKGGSYG